MWTVTTETPGGKCRNARVWDEEGRKRRADLTMSKEPMEDEKLQQADAEDGCDC